MNSSSIFIMIFMLITSFFLKSLFIGATFSCYIKQCDDEFGVLTTKQRMYVLTERLLDYELEWIRDYSGVEHETTHMTSIRKVSWWVIQGRSFRMASMLLICAQFTLTGLSNYDESVALRDMCAVFSAICTVGLTIEMASSALIHGWLKCSGDPWFIIDCVWLAMALSFTCVGIFEEAAGFFLKSHPFSLICFRLFRCLRYFRFFHVDPRYKILGRFVRAINKLQVINEAFVLSLGYIFQIGTLLVLCYVVFAILGMNLFGHLGSPGEHLTEMAHFSSFPHSLLTIVRISYGEDWQLIYEDIVFYSCEDEGDLRLRDVSACSVAWSASLFFVALFFFGVFCKFTSNLSLLVNPRAVLRDCLRSQACKIYSLR
jgi:hypothetical protein